MARKKTALPSERTSDRPDTPVKVTAPLRDSTQLQSVRQATDPERARVALLAADHCLDDPDPLAATGRLVDMLGLRAGARAVRGV